MLCDSLHACAEECECAMYLVFVWLAVTASCSQGSECSTICNLVFVGFVFRGFPYLQISCF